MSGRLLVTQVGIPVDLEWTEGDLVSMWFEVEQGVALGWTDGAPYKSEVRREQSAAAVLISELTVTVALVNTTDARVTLSRTLAQSATIPAGQYYWDMQTAAGLTLCGGRVRVRPQVTA